MSTRAQVKIVTTGVYLYQHCDGYDLPKTVQTVLKRKQRWDDDEYLTRIIFDEMKGDDTTGELGFGIGSKKHGDIEYLVIVDTDNQTVKVEGKGFDRKKYTFDEYINLTLE